MGIFKNKKKKDSDHRSNELVIIRSYGEAMSLIDPDESMDPFRHEEEPFLLFVYKNKEQAGRAFSRLPFIHITENGMPCCKTPEFTFAGIFSYPDGKDWHAAALIVKGTILADGKLYNKTERILKRSGGKLVRFGLPEIILKKYNRQRERLARRGITYD